MCEHCQFGLRLKLRCDENGKEVGFDLITCDCCGGNWWHCNTCISEKTYWKENE